MTEMKRLTFVADEELETAILNLRKRDEYVRLSVGEIVRMLVRRGLACVDKEGTA